MSAIDNAIARLQDIAQACTTVTIKNAPDYPIEDATGLPLSIAHITAATGNMMNSTTVELFPSISIDFHFARVNIKDAYQKINSIIPEYLQRLAGDPTLNATVDTIVWPVAVSVAPAQWDAVVTQMVTFTVPIKVMANPTT